MTTIMIPNNEGKIHDNGDIKMMTVNTTINNMRRLRRVLKDVNMVLVVLSQKGKDLANVVSKSFTSKHTAVGTIKNSKAYLKFL